MSTKTSTPVHGTATVGTFLPKQSPLDQLSFCLTLQALLWVWRQSRGHCPCGTCTRLGSKEKTCCHQCDLKLLHSTLSLCWKHPGHIPGPYQTQLIHFWRVSVNIRWGICKAGVLIYGYIWASNTSYKRWWSREETNKSYVRVCSYGFCSQLSTHGCVLQMSVVVNLYSTWDS